ncbi:hypothetical protein [Tardisphaera saccharovorans]
MRDSASLLCVLKAERPDVVFQMGSSPFWLPVLVSYKLAKPRAKLVLKLDLNPEWEGAGPGSLPVWMRPVFKLNIFLSSFLYDLIVVETPCGYRSLLK